MPVTISLASRLHSAYAAAAIAAIAIALGSFGARAQGGPEAANQKLPDTIEARVAACSP